MPGIVQPWSRHRLKLSVILQSPDCHDFVTLQMCLMHELGESVGIIRMSRWNTATSGRNVVAAAEMSAMRARDGHNLDDRRIGGRAADHGVHRENLRAKGS